MKQLTSRRPVRVGMVSLGCAKNLVDAEVMLGALLQDGLELTNQPERADVLIVNTCSFIADAQQESIEAILESAQLRDARRRGQALVVAGCLPQRFAQELPKLLPEADAFMGLDQVQQVSRIVRQALARRAQRLQSRTPKVQGGSGSLKALGPAAAPGAPKPEAPGPVVEVSPRPSYIPDYATARFRLTPPHLAYLKIAEGCNHPCSFCIIPRIRGPHRSRPLDDIVREARALLAAGVKELNLISQDTTFYGVDLWPGPRPALAGPDGFERALRQRPAEAPTLARLLRELNSLPGQFWIRLLYTHPAHWTDELIQTIAECPKVVRYVDLPMQHIHPNMLERMRRETSAEYLVELIRRLRAGLPGLTLRTTFIVGFPGETEACFERLLEFIRQTRFERLGVFTYSAEEGTRAARMAGQVPERVKQHRRAQAMALQRQIAREMAAAAVGRTLTVLVEGTARPQELEGARLWSWEHGLLREAKDGQTGDRRSQAELQTRHAPSGNRGRRPAQGSCMVARSQGDAPDIDGRVYVRGRLPMGQFAQVRVLGHSDYDLIAEPA